jgi:hypothetical protein
MRLLRERIRHMTGQPVGGRRGVRGAAPRAQAEPALRRTLPALAPKEARTRESGRTNGIVDNRPSVREAHRPVGPGRHQELEQRHDAERHTGDDRKIEEDDRARHRTRPSKALQSNLPLEMEKQARPAES